ncbi:MAG: MFS transporter [Sulfolobaceae archaeon]|nr:MFS transporter [Sulfolobaceae archaeon]
MKNSALIAGLLLTITEWYVFFLISQLSFIVFPISLGALIFSLGFLGRVLGSMLFGHIGDKVSGKLSIVLVLIFIFFSSLIFLLSDSTPAIVFARILQSLSLGGEWGSVSIMVSDSLMNSRYRVFILSLIQLAVPLGLILSTFMIFLLIEFFTTKLWNYTFLVAIILLIPSIVFLSKVNIKEQRATSKVPLSEVLRFYWRELLLGIGIKVSESADFYIFTSYIFALSSTSRITSVLVLIAILTQLFSMPLMGYLANNVGKERIVLLGLLLFLVSPLMLERNILLGEVMFATADSALYSPQSAILVDLFNKKNRFTGTNLTYQLASLLGGSSAPLILAFTHLPIFYVIIPYVMVTFTSVILIKRGS